jgi:carbamoylphosphate synthase small subunit
MIERGATRQEVEATIVGGEIFQAKFGRVGFRRNFPVNGIWRGRRYTTKQMEVYAVEEDGWNVITVIVKYFHA